DLGNVLLRFRPDRLIIDMYKDEKIRDAIMEAVFRAPEWQMLDRGTIDIEDATVAFVNRSPRHEKEIRAVMEVWTKALTPIDPHVRLLEDLKRKGMHCYILSNFHKEAFEEQQALHSFFSSFDGGVVSAYVQLLKPERDIGQDPGHTWDSGERRH
ncbi:HAD family phosphatase, partial [Aduncisulcus paluster]